MTMILILGSYAFASLPVDEMIFIFAPTMATVVLRPHTEAILIPIFYYALFFVLNFFGYDRLNIPPNQLLLHIIINVVGLYVLYLYVESNRAFQKYMEMTNRFLFQETTTDILTQLPNRKAFEEQIAAYLQAHRLSGESFVFAIVDIDHFKHINDTFGHAEGDKLYRHLQIYCALLSAKKMPSAAMEEKSLQYF
jgi:predicted signal transduction protein with EAL and GGDEF domain